MREIFDALPWPLKAAVLCVIAAVIIVLVAALIWPKRDNRPDHLVGPKTAAMRRIKREREPERADLRHKPAGQERLTQDAEDPGPAGRPEPEPDLRGTYLDPGTPAERFRRPAPERPTPTPWPDPRDAASTQMARQPAQEAADALDPAGWTGGPDTASGEAYRAAEGDAPQTAAFRIPLPPVPATGMPRQPSQRPQDGLTPLPPANHPRETRAERRERLRAEGRQD